MASSLPQLATSCGGTLEIVQHNVTGLLHPPPSAGEAADAQLLEHILRLDRRTAAGRALSERLGIAGCRQVLTDFLPRQFHDSAEALLGRWQTLLRQLTWQRRQAREQHLGMV